MVKPASARLDNTSTPSLVNALPALASAKQSRATPASALQLSTPQTLAVQLAGPIPPTMLPSISAFAIQASRWSTTNALRIQPAPLEPSGTNKPQLANALRMASSLSTTSAWHALPTLSGLELPASARPTSS